MLHRKKKRKLYSFFRIFLRKKKNCCCSIRFQSNNDFLNRNFLKSIQKIKIKIGDYIWFRKRGEDSLGWEKSRNARSIERQLERTVKEPLATSLKSRDYSDLLYRVNCGIKFARREWKKKEGWEKGCIYIPDEDKMGAKEKNKTWNTRKRRVNWKK